MSDAPPGIRTAIRTASITCGTMPAHLAVPADLSRTPCVIVMHERYGLVRHTRELADRFAREGYVAIAPDLFYRHPDQDALHRGLSGYELSDGEAVESLTGAIAALQDVAEADPQRVAAMGVCQTGRHPLVLAAVRPIAAALVWYGAVQPREWAASVKYPRPLDDIIAALACPVFGMFGETDHLISIDDVRRFRDRLEGHGKSFSVTVLRDCPHGFLNDTMPGRYRRPQAEAAWAAQRAFLAEAFAPGPRDRALRSQRYAADYAGDYDFSRHVRLE